MRFKDFEKKQQILDKIFDDWLHWHSTFLKVQQTNICSSGIKMQEIDISLSTCEVRAEATVIIFNIMKIISLSAIVTIYSKFCNVTLRERTCNFYVDP